MARIAFVLSKTPWRDRRPFFRQGPVLAARGHELLYAAAPPDDDTEHPFRWIALSPSERRLARRTGGLNLYAKIRGLDADLVQLCSLELLPLGVALKASTGARVVYDCREDIASALFERRKSLPLWARHLLFRSVRALEGLAARRFDAFVTADPGVRDLHARMPSTRKHVFYNTALLSQFPRSYPPLAEREYDIAVLGSLSSNRSGAQDVVEALGLLAERGLRLRALFVGEPENEMRSLLRDRIQKHRLDDRITITGHLPHELVASALAKARIGIVPLHDHPKFHRNIACKAFEYMSCGMPTIASDLPPQHLFLDDQIARFYPCGDVAALADAILELHDAGALLDVMGERARQAVEDRWNGELDQMAYAEFIERILSMPRRGSSDRELA